MKSSYYDQSVALGAGFQSNNKSWAGLDVVKYQKQIHDLVIKYNAKTILDYGCGKGSQYTEKLPYNDGELKTFDEWLGVTVYKYDPCVPEFATPPPAGMKFDGVICSQVLQTIPDADLPWVAEQLSAYADRFCFISLNFQRPAKAKKMIYDTEYFKQPRTREFFKSFFSNWSGSDVYWWWKDRAHYDQWVDDQLNGNWTDLPAEWTGKYQYVEAIYQ